MQDFGRDLAAVLGGLAQLVLSLLVDVAAGAFVPDRPEASADRVLIPGFQLFSEVTNLA